MMNIINNNKQKRIETRKKEEEDPHHRDPAIMDPLKQREEKKLKNQKLDWSLPPHLRPH